jgi:superfamily I DNA and RNA helicase
MSSYFFLEAEKKSKNAALIEALKEYSESNQTLVYVIDRPLTDQKYSYKYSEALIVLSSKNKITIIDYGNNEDQFQDFVEDVIEDIGSISDKYLYKEVIGRPRMWRKSLLETELCIEKIRNITQLFKTTSLFQETDRKKLDLLISLFIGSINDIDRVKEDIPNTVLDKVKQKIQLFDGDQTRFIYKRFQIKNLSYLS